jgi:hypothetical protein
MLEAASVSYGKATPYFPVVELLKRYVHVEDGDEPRTMRARVTGHLLTLDEALQDTIPALLDALPADSPFLRGTRRGPSSRAGRTPGASCPTGRGVGQGPDILPTGRGEGTDAVGLS